MKDATCRRVGPRVRATVPVDAPRWSRLGEEADMGFPRFLFTIALAGLTATAVSAQPATRNLTGSGNMKRDPVAT